MLIRLGCATVQRWSSYRIHAAAATRVPAGAPNLTNWPAFVFCENNARFCQCNQQYLKPVFA
jgi:hypothetical protein